MFFVEGKFVTAGGPCKDDGTKRVVCTMQESGTDEQIWKVVDYEYDSKPSMKRSCLDAAVVKSEDEDLFKKSFPLFYSLIIKKVTFSSARLNSSNYIY